MAMADIKSISTQQLRMIYGLAKKAGMDGDLLHARALAVCGKEHLHELSCMQAAELIDSLTGKDTSARRQYDAHGKDTRPVDRVGQAQINRIVALARKIGWMEEGYGRLNGFIRAKYGVERLDWLTPDKAIACIEALKGMAGRGYGERASKKGG